MHMYKDNNHSNLGNAISSDSNLKQSLASAIYAMQVMNDMERLIVLSLIQQSKHQWNIQNHSLLQASSTMMINTNPSWRT